MAQDQAGSQKQVPFDPHTLDKSIITLPLRQKLEADEKAQKKREKKPTDAQLAAGKARAKPTPELFPVIIDLNLEYPGNPNSKPEDEESKAGRAGARAWVLRNLNELVPQLTKVPAHIEQGLNADKNPKNQYVQQYLFVRLEGSVIRELAARVSKKTASANASSQSVGPRAIYRIWPDFPVSGLINKSISTVKADAAQASYAASGKDIVWAVLDSGIDHNHPHFTQHHNLDVQAPLVHTDFTGTGGNALVDDYGHGTHVAGIIAGEWNDPTEQIQAFSRQRDAGGDVTYDRVKLARISGIAPQCKLLSLKVMDSQGQGEASNLIAAIAMIQEINGHGRRLLVHGVNMSVGYSFNPEWFACGQSPLCVEVNRLVRSGVVVVVAAGNTGYGVTKSTFNGSVSAGMSLTINDPGNADLAITVGSTHRDMPHVYGVSYFSSKGPTGDGRLKPDLVAPGEKILSCAAGKQLRDMQQELEGGRCDYLEQSGTSMAAPHVSGAIAAFLSIRREFIEFPEKVKDLFTTSATDLKRERYFQGAGLVDLMRAIQSI